MCIFHCDSYTLYIKRHMEPVALDGRWVYDHADCH